MGTTEWVPPSEDGNTASCSYKFCLVQNVIWWTKCRNPISHSAVYHHQNWYRLCVCSLMKIFILQVRSS